jgi:hypothetical protein
MRTQRPRSWSELSPRQRGGAVTAAVLQLALLGAALRDLRRRPADKVRGDKRLWVLVSLVSFVGPLTYFAFGRKEPDD